MKRLCVFVVYDKEKIVDSYVGFLLRSLKYVTSKIIVVCNFDEVVEGIGNLQGETVYFRENIGYDAGAYQYVLSKILSWEELYDYDELLLTNDTYFGPFYPLEDMFQAMSEKHCDFWGITRHPEGMMSDQVCFDTHIQSYFLVFRKSVLHSKVFREFWINLPRCEIVQEVIRYFEVGISETLSSAGFKGMAYMDGHGMELQYNENPYLKYSLELIRDCRIPILKKRSVNIDNDWYYNAIEALKYVEAYIDYDESLIEEHLKRLGKIVDGTSKFDFAEMDQFVKSHRKIYIYGNGKWAKNLDAYFEYKEWPKALHLVSKNKIGEDVLLFDEIELSPGDGIIIAVQSKKMISEILSIISSKCCSEQIFCPLF